GFSQRKQAAAPGETNLVTLHGQRLRYCCRPFIPLATLPHHHHEPRTRFRSTREVRECGNRVCKEHRAKPAEEHVEIRRLKFVDLRIAELVGDVLQPGCERQTTGSIE